LTKRKEFTVTAMKTIDEMLDSVAERLNVSAPAKTPSAPSPKISPKPTVKADMQSVEKYDGLNLELAKKLAQAVEIAARMMKINVVVAIVDSGANLMLLHSMDDAYIASVKVAQDKAYTAAALKMPTYKALEMSRGGALDGLTNGNGIMLLGGGEPLTADGKLCGAIGVSGGTKEQDIALSKVGAVIFNLMLISEK
jgi:uncharacterized protein GlcG (DUF336 family)